jgi:hypothetical protein
MLRVRAPNASRPPPQDAASGPGGAGLPPAGLPGAVSVPAAGPGGGFAPGPLARGGGGGGSGGGFADDAGVGSRSALGAVLERNRVNIIMPTPPQAAPKLDDGGGDGGGLGKNNHNGGGGGDGGGGDDDDYFGAGGEGDGEGGGGGGGGGDGFFRLRVPELFDRAALSAVLQEWHKTIADLPLILRRAAEMGLFSSAQLVRFLAMDVRPGAARAVSRALPPAAAREFVGRLMADPAFVQKLSIEAGLAFAASMLHEWRVRGDALAAELDLAAINSAALAAAVAAAVWVTAPSRAVGAVAAAPWQRMLAGLPHCVFDASGPLRSYTPAARLGGFFASAAQLAVAGAAAAAAAAGASSLAVAARRRADPEWRPSAPVPEVARSAAGLAAFFALNANLRYQLLGGMDRYLFGHASALWSYVLLTSAARFAGAAAGELSRPWWQGLPTETAASHLQRRQRVRRVKKRVPRKPLAQVVSEAPDPNDRVALLLAHSHPESGALAALAAASAGGRLAAAAPPGAHTAAGAAGGEQQREQEQRQQAHAGDGGDGGRAADHGGLEAQVEGRLGLAPALMGSPEGLARLAHGGSGAGGAAALAGAREVVA